jgi:outer membrane murein-binding lipoprotein Lpp
MSINGLPLWASCTYRVHTKCGFPAFTYNSESDITGEFDMAYTYYDGYTLDDDINSWEFNQTSSFAGLIVSQTVNTTLVVPGTIEHSEYEDCSSKDRNLYLTVTRVKNNNQVAEEPEVPAADNITTPEQRRVLQTGDLSNIYFTFTISAAQLVQLTLAAVVVGLTTLAL